jgi:hypothetical protein
MANNTLPEDITKTINDIITELDAFSENVKTEYTLTGSVAVYLFVYSLYINEYNAEKKKIIKEELFKLQKPNDIDIVIYTSAHLPKENFNAYKKIKPINKNNTIPALNSIDGLPIKRREASILNIDLIITKPKKVDDSIKLTFKHHGIEKTFNIVHPQTLLSLYAPDDNRGNKQNANSVKLTVLNKLKENGLLPEKEKLVSRFAPGSSMRGLSFGNENSPSSSHRPMRRMSFGKANSPSSPSSPSSATKRKRNTSTLRPISFGNSPPKSKKPSVKRRFSFSSANST